MTGVECRHSIHSKVILKRWLRHEITHHQILYSKMLWCWMHLPLCWQTALQNRLYNSECTSKAWGNGKYCLTHCEWRKATTSWKAIVKLCVCTVWAFDRHLSREHKWLMRMSQLWLLINSEQTWRQAPSLQCSHFSNDFRSLHFKILVQAYNSCQLKLC